MSVVGALVVVSVLLGASVASAAELPREVVDWQEGVLKVPYPAPAALSVPARRLVRQDYEKLEINRSVIATPIKIGSKSYSHGLGTHSVSRIGISSPEPMARFAAWVGVDNNERTAGGQGSVAFVVQAGGKELFRSEVLRGGMEPVRVDVALGEARAFDLRVEDAGDGPGCDHADWAEAEIELASGKKVRVDEMPDGGVDVRARYPFSFVYGGKLSDALLPGWTVVRQDRPGDADRAVWATTWTDAATGLRVGWEVVRYRDFGALEWLLTFENTGKADTPILSDVQAMDLALEGAIDKATPFRLYRSNGAPADPTDFDPVVETVADGHSASLAAGGGRSSNKDFPFFKVETGKGSAVVAVGWSGQWAATASTEDNARVRIAAGMELTHLTLHPGEKIRTPRMLILFQPGDTWEANARFRELIQKHYAAKRAGKAPEPILFCNTCFTRGGGWLNECTAENQISLIRAYAPLGLEALITDAGWFEGGWPAGAGNWEPRKDAYPQGMAPVAKAALDNKMVYGLWYEPERVVAGTDIHKKHPEWCLKSQKAEEGTYLLNFGLPQVQEHFFGIVKGFMDLPGFRFYRQDFNMDPLPYWRFNDAQDRQGMTEIRYVEGLYAYWDRIATTWPDSIREECASGGRRIDVETVRRMHLHQKTDYWFDNEVDQNSLWSLSQYLPNNTIVAHLCRLDDYSFRSVLASSLCLGWITDDPKFDTARGKALLDRYRELRPLLTGAFYPALPCTRQATHWIASQYHRADLDAGLILAFRHAQSPYRTADLTLRGLTPDAEYELRFENTGEKRRAKGADLLKGFALTVTEPHGSEMVEYRRVKE